MDNKETKDEPEGIEEVIESEKSEEVKKNPSENALEINESIPSTKQIEENDANEDISKTNGDIETESVENIENDKEDPEIKPDIEPTVEEIIEEAPEIAEMVPPVQTKEIKRKTKVEELKGEIQVEKVEQKENVDHKTDTTTFMKPILGKVDEAPVKTVAESDEMGKGKRARIPNKRYSDIILSPNRRNTSVHKLDISESDSSKSNKDETTPAKRSRQSIREHLQDVKYLKPFKFGWKREVVYQSTENIEDKKIMEIFYYTPEGKKVKNTKEVAHNLTGKVLSTENFTFAKDLIGVNDPEKEVIITYSRSNSPNNTENQQFAKKIADNKKPKKTTGTEGSKSEQTGARGKRKTMLEETDNEKEVNSNKKITKIGGRKGRGSLPNKRQKIEEPMEVASSITSPSVRASNKPRQPCSIRCKGVDGVVPTLQCIICVCLYHHECVGMANNINFSYICKNCELQGHKLDTSSNKNLQIAPSTSAINAQSTVNPIEDKSAVEDAQFTAEQNAALDNCNKSLVGSVTSWLPHHVKILNNTAVPTDIPRPQYIEYLAGRKFLVIPKYNFMSVSAGSSMPPRPEESILTPNDALQPTDVPISSASLGPMADVDEPINNDEHDNDNKIKVECSNNEDEALKIQQPIQQPSGIKTNKRNLNVKSITNNNEDNNKSETKFMDNFIQNLSFGYNTLLHVFQYLKVQDLLRAGCVCNMWNDLASHPLLWRTVRMKNSQVHSFEGLANALKKHGTVNLDLRKMLLPNNGDDSIWSEFSKAISRVDCLRKIELCRCPASVVEELTVSNPNLLVINSVTIKSENLNLDSFKSLNCIQELRLKATTGLNINSIDSLKELKTLKILSLTSINELSKLNLEVIAQLVNLESLDLGECSDFPKNFGEDILVKLQKLEKLRLEKGQGTCHTFELLESVKSMKSLEQLELVNFDVKSGFDKAIGACTNIKKLMIIPTYISQSATTNNMVLAGVLRLQSTLSHFVWGVTLELLRVTELFVDQCEDSNKKEKKLSGNGDCIPVLKPIPDLTNGGTIQETNNPPEVEILPLPNLQKLLLNSLPTTRVKILKIPFHATWRQTLTDSV